MDMIEYIKDALKVLGAILTLSATPEGLAKGVAVTAIVLIAGMLWKLLKEFRGWREEQSAIARDVRRLTVDTNFLVGRHCKIHETDALELLNLRQQGDSSEKRQEK